MIRPPVRLLALLAVAGLCGYLLSHDPVWLAQSSRHALTNWWEDTVPIMFPLLALVHLALGTPSLEAPQSAWRLGISAFLLSLVSFPLVGSTLVLDAWEQGKINRSTARLLLIWANPPNPFWLLLPAPVWAVLGGFTLVSTIQSLALLRTFPGSRETPPRWHDAPTPRTATVGAQLQPVLAAMDWTTVIGAAQVTGAWFLGALPASWQWTIALALGPVAARPLAPLWQFAAALVNGAVFLAPLRREGIPFERILTDRLLQAAAMLALALLGHRLAFGVQVL